MSLFELIFFQLAVVFSLYAVFFFHTYIGWWSVIPGVVLGTGAFAGCSFLFRKIPEWLRTPYEDN